jgi:hypothetical protein
MNTICTACDSAANIKFIIKFKQDYYKFCHNPACIEKSQNVAPVVNPSGRISLVYWDFNPLEGTYTGRVEFVPLYQGFSIF